MVRLVAPLLCAAVVWLYVNGAPYANAPPLAHTGGFGESSCHSCHFDAPLNDETASVAVEWTNIEPHVTRIKIRTNRDDLGAAGFMLSSRSASGSQAGTLKSRNDRVEVRSDTSGIQYAHHTPAGTEVSDSVAGWTMDLIEDAGKPQADTTIINVAVNAANGDDSEFGDLILTREYRIPARRHD